jgi:hypothetical protein
MVWPFSSTGQQRPQLNINTLHNDDYEGYSDQIIVSSETRRVFLSLGSTTVYGYPSAGGFFVLFYCNGVDLDVLGLSRFKTAERSEDLEAEDRHCARMRKLGAWKFTSCHEYEYMNVFQPEKLERQIFVFAGWPENGPGVIQ